METPLYYRGVNGDSHLFTHASPPHERHTWTVSSKKCGRNNMVTVPDYPETPPTRPIWPGFAINTGFYAAILWLLFAFPFVIRRRRRIKRGLCAKCGYDLRGRGGHQNLCPECGTDAPSPSEGEGRVRVGRTIDTLQ
jgi:hypothetical protein